MANKHTKLHKRHKAREVNLFVFSNDGINPGNSSMLQMFYRGAYDNSIGLMQGKNKLTGELEWVLVGIDPGTPETGPGLHPLAVVLNPSTSSVYLAPDGKGGFYSDDGQE